MLEFTLVHAPAGLKAARLLLIGAGKREQFNSAVLRKAAGAALRYLKSRSVKNLAFVVREGDATEDSAQTIVEGALAADFESHKYKTDKKNDKRIESIGIAGYSEAERAKGEKGLAKGRIIADSQNFARDLINEPSNKLTPTILAQKAEAMAKAAGLSVEVLDEKKIADLKMGALLSVAQGSVEPPRMIVITYNPANPKPGAPVIGLIGKAVTFDTGGISIKPSEGMEKMKYDMAGGATMIGVMRALASLKPNVKVICVVPSTENMPGGRAQKPGDVQTAMSGKTIEVLNTDAEGRLILADGVHYAKQLGATHLIDAATLTGAVSIALGKHCCAILGNDELMIDAVRRAGELNGERIWPLPLYDEYFEDLKSDYADMKNSANDSLGGTIRGAIFLKQFIRKGTRWAHLDIAGPARADKDEGETTRGATGYGVRLLLRWLESVE